MADDSMESVLERAVRLQQDMLEKHDARMARLDRNYDKLVEIAADVAETNDRLEDQMHRLGRTQRDIARLLERQEERITQNEVRITQNEEMLRQLIEMQRRRNGGQTP
jgi:chromosome segregation ATPase